MIKLEELERQIRIRSWGIQEVLSRPRGVKKEIGKRGMVDFNEETSLGWNIDKGYHITHHNFQRYPKDSSKEESLSSSW